MARTKQQIEKSIASDMESINPSLDTVKGPIPDIFIRPQAIQIRATEQKIDDLNKRYSLEYIRTTNTESLELYGANHGLRKSPGRPATGNVYFFMFTRLNPGEVLTIPAGTVVSTSNTSISYQTTREALIIGNNIDAYYNATRRVYEVKVPVSSLGTGEIFEIPAGRIRQIQSSVSGLDGVENRAAIRGSLEAETNESFGRHIQDKFNGTALGSGDGLKQLIVNFDTTRILEAKLIFSSNQALFRRRTRRAAWDIYLIGEDDEEVTETFTGDGIATQFILSNQPVSSVSSVTINGINTPFTFSKDNSDQFKNSSRSADKIILAAAPGPGIPIEIDYTFDRLITDTQDYVDNIQVNLYEADSLVRQAIQVELKIGVTIQVLSSFDETQAIADTIASIQDFANINTFVEILYPEKLRTKIASEVGGISAVTITDFTRLDNSTLPIEAIEFKGNEYPVLSDSNITITTRR